MMMLPWLVHDYATLLYGKLPSEDGFILGSPVHYDTFIGIMKTFMDRFLPFHDDPESESELRCALRLKPAGAIALRGTRNNGIEFIPSTFYRFFLYNDMVAVGTAGYPGTASNLGGTVHSDSRPDAATRDTYGRNSLRAVGIKVSSIG